MGGAELSYHFVNSAILTALVSLFVLWRYRVAVLDGMMRGDTAVVPLPLPFGLPVTPRSRTGRACSNTSDRFAAASRWRIG